MRGNTNVGNTKELKNRELTHISLCTGYGGIDLGLKRALGAIRTVCYVEIEAFAIENLVAKIEAGGLDTAPIFTDLKTYPWELFNGKVDLLSGGFPCQPFSSAGKRKGSEDPRHLWPHITDGIKRLGRPSIVFFENVEGIISSKLSGNEWTDSEGTPVLLHVLRELERMGYKATAGVFSACEVGAPHQRKRVFILGIRNELGQTGISLINELIKRNDSDSELAYSEHKRLLQCEHTSRYWERLFKVRGSAAYPAPRGQKQYWYEPPRVTVDNAKSLSRERNSRTMGEAQIKPLSEKNGCVINCTGENAKPRELHRQIESSLGRDVNGAPDWLGYAKLYESCDNGSLQTSKLGDSDSKGFLRNSDESTDTKPQRRHDTNGHYAKADSSSRELHRQIESSLGRDVNGAPDRLDYAKLYESYDNRTDELRMLGNGVVPDTATRAFRVLWGELVNSAR